MVKISSIILICCLVVSFLSVLYKSRPQFLRAFPVYFLVSVCVQLYGEYLGNTGQTNVPLYNLYSTLEFSFYFFVLRCVIQNPLIRKILFFLIPGFPAFSFLNVYLIQGTNVFLTMSYGIGCLLIAVFCILYFVELFQLPRAIDLKTSPAFWICTATLFSYICTFPFWGMVNLLSVSEQNYDKAAIMVNVINILTYILFLIAFLCRIRVRKFTS